MYSAKELAIARLIKPDIEVTQLDVTDLAVLQLVRKATGGGSGVYNATITNGIATFGGVTVSKPLVSLKLNIPVTQTGSGTPSPDNVRDFIGVSGVDVTRTGTNLWDEEVELGYINTNTGLDGSTSDELRSKSNHYYQVLPNTQYYFKQPVLGVMILFYDRNKSYIGRKLILGGVFIPPSNAAFFRITLGNRYGTTYNHDISINYPSTDTEYHPYTGNTYQIAFGQTVYSANLDVLTGKLSITHEYQVYNGSEDWQISSTGNNYYLEIGVNSMITDTIIANEFENPHRAPTVDYTGIYNTSRFIQVRPSSAELDLQAWKTWLNSNNLQVVYELATPIEIDLTPTVINTLIGDNVIFADVGDITECKYTRK